MLRPEVADPSSAARPSLRSLLQEPSGVAFAALLALALGLSFEARQGLITLGGVSVLTTSEALIGLALALWAITLLSERRFPVLPKPVAWAAGAWLALLILSTIFAPGHRHEALLFLCRVIAGLLLGWACFDQLSDRARAEQLALLLGLGGLLAALLGLLEATELPGLVGWLSQFKAAQTRVGEMLRTSGPLSYATILSMVLELCTPLLLASALTIQRRGLRWLLLMGVLLMLAAQVLTLSRSGVVTLLLGFGLLFALGLWKGQRDWIAAGGLFSLALAGLVAALLVWNPLASLRLSTETEQSWYGARAETPAQIEAQPGETIEVTITLVNTGVRAWSMGGEQRFVLSYHLLDEAGASIDYDGPRTALPHDVAPGETIQLAARVEAPPEPGRYRVAWDMLQEDVAWFSWKGNPTPETTLIVAGAAVSAQSWDASAPPSDLRVLNPTPGRSDLWRAGWQMFLDRPLLGVGPDNFRWRYGDYAGLSAWDTGIHANNLYIEWLADTGLIGLAAFLWLSYCLVEPLARRLLSRPEPLLIGVAMALLAWYAHGLLDFFYEFTPTYALFWMIAGLGLRLGQWAGRGEVDHAHRL